MFSTSTFYIKSFAMFYFIASPVEDAVAEIKENP